LANLHTTMLIGHSMLWTMSCYDCSCTRSISFWELWSLSDMQHWMFLWRVEWKDNRLQTLACRFGISRMLHFLFCILL